MTAPLTYSIPEAAERLGAAFTVDFLKKNLSSLPHIKTGRGTGRSGRVAFTEVHLAQILAKYSVEPQDAPEPELAGRITRRTRRTA